MNAETLAASKIGGKKVKDARDAIAVGHHDVDFWVHVVGSFNVGVDYQTAPTVAIPYKKAFAALCKVSGCTGKAGINKIREAMELALADESETTAKTALDNQLDLEKIEREVIEPMLQGLPKLDCRGKVTTKLKWEIREA